MNKLTKIGLSALCGSLASITAANAGSLEVLGTAEATWTNKQGLVSGNPIGMNTGMTFKGSGELDGGQTFSVSTTLTDKAVYSTSNITLVTNSVGTFKLSSAEGSGGIGGFDDVSPTAWEEVWDSAIATNVNMQKGVGSSMNVNWSSPSMFGTQLHLAYSPDNDGTQNTNKATSGAASDHFGAGWDVVLDINPQWDNFGFRTFVGASETQIAKSGQLATKDLQGEHQEAVVGLGLTFGPVVLGGQVSAERTRAQAAGAPEYYGNTSWGVAFNVNDSLSVSYGEARHVQSTVAKKSYADGGAILLINPNRNFNEYTPKSWMRGSSVQVAYTVGGLGLKYSDTTYDNTAYGFDAKVPLEARVFAVSMAF